MSAWEESYRFKIPFMGSRFDTPRMKFACSSIKHELVALGFGPLKLSTPALGPSVRGAIKRLQAAAGIKVDGILGKESARALWGPRMQKVAEYHHIPEMDLRGLVFWESAGDPAALYVNDDGSRDRGLVQINNKAHPDVSDMLAFDAAFSIVYAARIFERRLEEFAGGPVRAETLAIAAWKSPAKARVWFNTGEPPPPLSGEVGIEQYVERVRAAA